MITVKEIASRCNVSISTVSNILNGKPKVSEETRQKVMKVVQETGYLPNYYAQGMRRQNTKVIGIIVEDLSEFTTPIVETAMAYCEDNNYRTILVNMRMYDRWQDTWYEDEQKLKSVLKPSIQELISFKVDGIIYVAGHCRKINCFPEKLEMPGVVAYAISAEKKFPSVVIDDEHGGYELTNYLIQNGHRRIGVIAGSSDNLHTQKRCVGYQKALYEAGILYNPAWIQYGTWEQPSGYDLAARLLREEITALFCMNDKMAAGAYDYLYEKGIQIGRQISIVGYDDVGIARYLRPQLTTCAIQLKQIGRESARMVLSLLNGSFKMDGENENIVTVPCKIVERNSVMKL